MSDDVFGELVRRIYGGEDAASLILLDWLKERGVRDGDANVIASLLVVSRDYPQLDRESHFEVEQFMDKLTEAATARVYVPKTYPIVDLPLVLRRIAEGQNNFPLRQYDCLTFCRPALRPPEQSPAWMQALALVSAGDRREFVSRTNEIRLRPYPSKSTRAWRVEVSYDPNGQHAGAEWYVDQAEVFRAFGAEEERP